jgi:hypothetical protein
MKFTDSGAKCGGREALQSGAQHGLLNRREPSCVCWEEARTGYGASRPSVVGGRAGHGGIEAESSPKTLRMRVVVCACGDDGAGFGGSALVGERLNGVSRQRSKSTIRDRKLEEQNERRGRWLI